MEPRLYFDKAFCPSAFVSLVCLDLQFFDGRRRKAKVERKGSKQEFYLRFDAFLHVAIPCAIAEALSTFRWLPFASPQAR